MTREETQRAEREKLAKLIRQTLEGLAWTPGEVNAYLAAQMTHGVLRRGLFSWEYRAHYAAWPKMKPRTPQPKAERP